MSRSDQGHPAQHLRRAAATIASPLLRFFALEAASGILLLAATVAALIWANLWPESYAGVWHARIGGRIGPWIYEQPLHFWVNDGLMTVFFFVVGLEIRREIFDGELAGLRKAALPLVAAVGGMLAPAAIFAVLNAGRATAQGWAIPMATDIAFAVGALTVLGSRVPHAWRVLLLALAVIDDIGAIFVIAVFYSAGISWSGLGVVGLGVIGVLTMRAAGIRTAVLYLAPGGVVWGGLLIAGIHPTLGGVLLGLLTPVRPRSGPAESSSLDSIERARGDAVSPAERLLDVLHPWVAFAIMPLFALANAGVTLGGAQLAGDALALFLGVIAGLAIGKPLGIAAASRAAMRLGLAAGSDAVTGPGVLLVGLVGGIGFTMSLFIAQLAFAAGALLDTAKLAILAGSATSLLVGLAFGAATLRRR